MLKERIRGNHHVHGEEKNTFASLALEKKGLKKGTKEILLDRKKPK